MGEAAASFVRFLHQTGSYTFHGDAPIGGLLPIELDYLLLGYIVEQEQAEDARAQAGDERPEQRRRKQGRKARARQQFAETGRVA